MKYIKYFGILTKNQGLINLDITQFQRLMNIVHIEGVLFGLHKAREANKNTLDYNKFEMILFREDKKLTELMGDQAPEVLIKGMLQLSRR